MFALFRPRFIPIDLSVIKVNGSDHWLLVLILLFIDHDLHFTFSEMSVVTVGQIFEFCHRLSLI